MPKASEVRDQGNKAFQNGDYEKAIEAYTKAIKLNEKDHQSYSNRSAAYLKSGNAEKALADGKKCVQIKSDYHKGYSRKGAAYHALKKYDKAIATYRAGLKVCPKVESLERGLAASSRAKNENTDAHRASLKSKAAKKAYKNQHKKADNADSVSSYVEQKRMELKLQKAALDAQLEFIDMMAKMSDEEKLQELFSVIDDDNNGYIDAKELATALRRRHANMTFQGSLEKAIDMVAIFDTDGDARLNLDEFQGYLDVMLQELNVTFQEFSEYMVFQTTFAPEDEKALEKEELFVDKELLAKQVKERGTLLEMLADPRLGEIFDLFDKEGTRLLTFKDVAIGLYQLTSDMEQSAKTSMELLLMMDKEDKRTVNYEQFGRLMMGIVATLGKDKSFDQMADELVLALTTNTTILEKDKASLFVAESVYTDFQAQTKQQNENAISYGRLNKLFQIWDTDKNGGMDYDELKIGLYKFEKSAGLSNKIEAAGVFDAFDNKQFDEGLNPQEFASVMENYSHTFNIDLHQLIDFMCLNAVLPDDRAEQYTRAYRETFLVNDKEANQSHINAVNLQYEFVGIE
eukprot:CAMPEP_0172450224 /NCGR_PEP_ID=MMETSP1065-20121228/8661_1 /TAXON_ID=265537 /ORGANISM="Amphiprora paludosa, Strain CCMP125" /LENGTH=572 /DNA_ID=CAMNT_0013202001 /DNA_START=227 /DNA_END=1945 /DNA_ORIENTATION=+